MSITKADKIKEYITGYRAKLAADNGKSDLLEALSHAEARLEAKSLIGIPVDDATAEAVALAAVSKIVAYNKQVQLPVIDVAALQAELAAITEAEADPEA